MPTSDAFQTTFETLRGILKAYERHFVVVADTPGRYYLATKTSRTASGAAIWFGGAEIKKNYVSFHLIPVYAKPGLLKKLSPALLKRMQGKSCFNFTALDAAHEKELTVLTRRGFDGFIKTYQ